MKKGEWHMTDCLLSQPAVDAAASTIDGSRDVDAMPNKRIYLQAAGQHGTGRFPPRENNRVTDGPVYRDNSLDIELRAPLATYTP